MDGYLTMSKSKNMSDDLKRFTRDLSGLLTRSGVLSAEQIRLRELEDSLESEREGRIRVSSRSRRHASG